jgi:cysteinyl-tRNA synthetase
MVNVWMHNGHLMVDGKKMSKSLGNFFTIRDLLQKYNPEAVRLSLIMTHYRQPLDWTTDSIEMAKQILNKWYRIIEKFEYHDFFTSTAQSSKRTLQTFCESHAEELEQATADFFKELCDDLNTPTAVQVLSQNIRLLESQQQQCEDADLHLAAVLRCADVLGLLYQDPTQWFKCGVSLGDEEIEEKIKMRELARNNKNFAVSDQIRDELALAGVQIEDSANGTKWRRI